MSQIFPCYGGFRAGCERCRRCKVRGYCKRAAEGDEAGAVRNRVDLEHPAALRAIAEVPDRIAAPGGRSFASWHAITRLVEMLASLHPITLAALQATIAEPGMCRAALLRRLGITPRTFQRRMQDAPEAARRALSWDAPQAPHPMPDEYVYISGPMTGIPDFNADSFFGAEIWLADTYGCRVVSPRLNAEILGAGREHEMYMLVALAELRTCTSVVLLDGWQTSKGCAQEVRLAIKLKLNIFELAKLAKEQEAARG